MGIVINVSPHVQGVAEVTALNETVVIEWVGATEGSVLFNGGAGYTEWDATTEGLKVNVAGVIGTQSTNLSATGGPPADADVTITFSDGDVAGTNVTDIVITNDTTGVASASVTQQGRAYVAPVDEIQLVALASTPSGGTFTLTFQGSTTNSLNWNASAAEVEAELIDLPTIGSGQCSVSGSTVGGFYVTFTGTLGGQDLTDSISGDGSALDVYVPDYVSSIMIIG